MLVYPRVTTGSLTFFSRGAGNQTGKRCQIPQAEMETARICNASFSSNVGWWRWTLCLVRKRKSLFIRHSFCILYFINNYLALQFYVYVILELTLIVGSAGLLDPRCHRRVGLKAIEWGPAASEIYSIVLFWTYSWMCKNFCVKKLLRVKASLCKDFSV